MLKFCLFIIVVCMFHKSTVYAENKTKEAVYYKHAETTIDPAVNKSTKPDVVKILIEGQPPSLKPVGVNLENPNLENRKVKKGSIKPRKGVLNTLEEHINHNDTLLVDFSAEKPVKEKTDEVSKKPIDLNTLKVIYSTPKSTTKPAAFVEKHIPPEDNAKKENATTTVKIPNPKPTVTIAGKEGEDEPMPPFPTNKSPLGMPRKIDYIVPVIITITALPLLGVAFYVLYKRGRDYWDKRHYRRMDFLIDGMYNE